jgi:CubicO group peptidase (beta-lactamase class C family)
MLHSGFLDEPDVKGQAATGYRYNATTGTTNPVPYFIPNSVIYAGGMYLTARDMSKFISAQFDNGRMLSNESKARMRYSMV